MSYFEAKMHQIRFRLGLCPRPRWGAYSAPPDPLAGFKGPTSKGREGRKERGRRGEGKVREKKEGKGQVREGRSVFSVQFVGNPRLAREKPRVKNSVYNNTQRKTHVGKTRAT